MSQRPMDPPRAKDRAGPKGGMRNSEGCGHARDPFKSPLDAELLEGWVEKAGDPRSGTPLGIERAIPTCGVYPAVPVDEQKDSNAGAEECAQQAATLKNYEPRRGLRRAGATSRKGLQ